MSQLPIITNALVMPGVSAVDSHWSLLVGLVIDDRQIAWGECLFSSAESDLEGGMNEAIYILQENIIPALIGQPLTNIVPLMEQIDRMRQEVTVVKTITAESQPPKRSRRELFSNLINPEQEIREVVERPLPPELRYGISQALFSAAAAVEERSIVEVIARLYGLQAAESPLPIHLIFDDLPNPTNPALARVTAASYGLAIGEGEPLKEFGRGGIRLQNRVRQLKNRAARFVDSNATPLNRELGFLFDLKGGFWPLYEQKTGPILGALYGLEQVTKPYALRLVDPVILDDWQGQVDIMKELQSFVRLRKMKTTLIARAGIETADDIQALVDNDCCGGILLDMAQQGTLHKSIEMALAAREKGVEVILAGVKAGNVPGQTAVHAALALNPTLLGVKVGAVAAVADEINRTLAWQEFRVGSGQ